MAKRFACRDIGMDCSFTARERKEEDLMKVIEGHFKEAHSMEIYEAKKAEIKAAIKEGSLIPIGEI